jgi:hypothetical protein
LPNQKILQLIQENTSVIDTFKIANQLLADAMRGVWRLVSFKGLIEIPLEDLCSLLQDRHFESAFAVAEAEGTDRQNTVMKKLLAHPMLEEGKVLSDAEAIIVSLTGGPNLTMAEVNHIVEQIKAKSGPSQVRMGACIDQSFGERLAVTLFCMRKLDREPAPRDVPRNWILSCLIEAPRSNPVRGFCRHRQSCRPKRWRKYFRNKRAAARPRAESCPKCARPNFPWRSFPKAASIAASRPFIREKI